VIGPVKKFIQAMKQQPDKLFRDKLLSHSKDVPPMVWDRIENGLKKKNYSFTWLFVAASITAAIASGYLLLSRTPDAVSTRVADMRTPIDSGAADSSVPVKERPVVPQIATVEAMPAPAIRKSGSKKTTSIQKELVKETLSVQKVTLEEQVQHALPDSSVHTYDTAPQLAFKALPRHEENVTIIITAEQTNQYLVNNKISKATSDEKKPSTLKKLLKKAADLKVNQDPFGDLRQKKNEILALNFRSEKQRGQKK
jgi:hypothetical protein